VCLFQLLRISQFLLSVLTWIFVLYLACFCLFIALILLFPVICRRYRLFLTKESKSTQFEAPSMSTVSTKEIAAIPQAGEQETKGISSPLERAESDPVSVMAEPTSRSFMLLPAPGLHKWLYCSREGNVFRAERRISFPFSSRQGHTSNTLPGKLPRDLARKCRPQVWFGILHFLVCVFLLS